MSNHSTSPTNLGGLLQEVLFRRALLFGGLITMALLAFEIFNYSTTDFALGDLLGDLKFLGVRWSTILAIAFCGIDFAGIARLFTPEQGRDEPAEVWYLFAAWLLAAAMNATLTWWGVSLAIINHETLGNAIVERNTLVKVVPVFVAVMVWLIRVLIIGTFSVAGERLFGVISKEYRRAAPQPAQGYAPRPLADRPIASRPIPNRPVASRPAPQAPAPRPAAALNPANNFRPAPKASLPPEEDPTYSPPEPTYHPIAASPNNHTPQTRM